MSYEPCMNACPECKQKGAKGACSRNKGHFGFHKCNRCGHEWSVD